MANFRWQSCIVLLGIIALAVFFPMPGACQQAEEMPTHFVIGYQAVPNAETVVKELGWNEKVLGIPVKWVQFDSGKHVGKAINEGVVDIGLMGTSPAAAAISEGAAIEVIWIHDVIGDNEGLVVRKESEINRVADLVGKRVAAPFGSTTHYHLMLALKLNNIEADKVDLINLEPGQMSAAWNRGEIDAGFVWEPSLSKMVEDGGKIILSSRQLAERAFPTADLCVVRKEFATRHPTVVIQYLKNLDRAVKLYRSEPEKAAAAVAKQLGISAKEAARQMKGLILLTGEEQISGKYVGNMQLHFGLYTLLKATADFLVQAKQIDASPPWPVFMRAVAPSYLQEALEKKRATLAGPRPEKE
jgi:taurine transport system substrate-binding protein